MSILKRNMMNKSEIGGQVLLDNENLSLALRWAETISTTKALVRQRSKMQSGKLSEADASRQRYKNHLDNSNDSVPFQNWWAGSDWVGRFGFV